jgi:hypothetical protein
MLNIRQIAPAGIAHFKQRFEDAYYRDELIDRIYQDQLRYFGIYQMTELIGGFVLYEGGRGPLKTLITPPFHPHIGLFVFNAQVSNTEIIDALQRFVREPYVCYLKLDLPLAFHQKDLPMPWRERWTYRLHLQQSNASLLAGVHATIKSSFQKSQREGCVFQEVSDKEQVIRLIHSNLHQKNVKYKSQLLDHIHHYFCDHPFAKYFGTFKDGHLVAANILYMDRGVAYHLFSAFDRSLSLNYANSAHLLATLIHLQAHSPEIHTFDFEGSTVPSIDFYFKRFGGIQCTYPSIYYSRLPFIFKQPE